jgi:hypothetical protein
MDPSAISYIIDHVFLPPKLPQEDDYNANYERRLVSCVRDALKSFEALAGSEALSAVTFVTNTITNLLNIRNEDGTLSQDKLESFLRQRSKGKHIFSILIKWLMISDECVPLHVKAQNAGMIITKFDDEISFEAFELSPLNKAFMSRKGRLRRSFPGSAFTIKQDTIESDIEVHEWPLPTKDTEAKATVFELDALDGFRAWRDVIAYLLHDILKCEYSSSHYPRA